MIKPAGNVPYIISFPQGAAGRFVKYLLHNLLTNSDVELHPCPVTNSTHTTDDRLYCGYSPKFDNSDADIWKKFNFDPIKINSDGKVGPRIFPTHQFPDFKLIKELIGFDVKIIIITVGPDDLAEVIINDKVKNTYDLLNGKSVDPFIPTFKMFGSRYRKFLGRPYPGNFVIDDVIQIGKCMALEAMPYFINKAAGFPNLHEFHDYEERIENFVLTPTDIDYPKDQLLLLPYRELYTSWKWMHKLEDFTNRKANPVTEESYQRYLDGRTKLVEKYRF